MNRWVAEANISVFKRKITEETDSDKRRILKELLAKEEEKLSRMLRR
jgi:hypothetical protein